MLLQATEGNKYSIKYHACVQREKNPKMTILIIETKFRHVTNE